MSLSTITIYAGSLSRLASTSRPFSPSSPSGTLSASIQAINESERCRSYHASTPFCSGGSRSMQNIVLDIDRRGCYTSFCTRSIDSNRSFCPILVAFARTGEKNWIKVDGWIRERPPRAAPKGNAKTLRQKDRIRTTLRKVRRWTAHQRGNRTPCFLRRKGISQVRTEAKGPRGSFCLFSFSPRQLRWASPPPVEQIN